MPDLNQLATLLQFQLKVPSHDPPRVCHVADVMAGFVQVRRPDSLVLWIWYEVKVSKGGVTVAGQAAGPALLQMQASITHGISPLQTFQESTNESLPYRLLQGDFWLEAPGQVPASPDMSQTSST